MRIDNSAKAVVSILFQCIDQSFRNITLDNWFTSIPLANTLLNDNKLTLVGTLKSNKIEIPQEFKPGKEREVKTSVFDFTKDLTLVSYVPRKKRSVILLSSLHHD